MKGLVITGNKSTIRVRKKADRPKVWVIATKVPLSNFLSFSSFLSPVLKSFMSFGGIKC